MRDRSIHSKFQIELSKSGHFFTCSKCRRQKKKEKRMKRPLQSNDSNPVGNFSIAIIGARK